MAFDLAAALKQATDSTTGNGPGRETINRLDLDKLIPNPNNFYSLDGIESLAANIEFNGLLDPIRVRENGDGTYTIISGHRRCAALRKLVEDGETDFSRVPCIIDRRWNQNPLLQELRLIYANSDTRKMTPADIAKQAERVTALLTDLKQQGFEFKGRMRDQVALICDVSASKIGRLHAIRENLNTDIYYDFFNTGRITEDQAYSLSRLPEEMQKQALCDMERQAAFNKPEPMFRKCVWKIIQRFVREANENDGSKEDEVESIDFKTLDNVIAKAKNVSDSDTILKNDKMSQVVSDSDTQLEEKIVSESDTIPEIPRPRWFEGEPEWEGKYTAKVDCGGGKILATLYYSDGEWYMFKLSPYASGAIRNDNKLDESCKVTCWWPLPED